MTESNRYVLGESESEHSRLRDQSVVLDPLTRLLLIDAGITEGMRVLDIGTGSGAVAALAADLVGSHGHVLAVDRDPTALDGARTLLGHREQIEFAEADVAGLDLDEEFDAIGVHSRMGRELFAAFRSAGLPDPHLTMGAPVGGGDQAPSFGWTNSLTALLPYLEQQEMASDGEFTADSLTQRLDDEIDAANATLLGPLLYGAHCTVP